MSLVQLSRDTKIYRPPPIIKKNAHFEVINESNDFVIDLGHRRLNIKKNQKVHCHVFNDRWEACVVIPYAEKKQIKSETLE